MTPKQYLDALHEKHGWSDYRISKQIGVSPQSVSLVRGGKSKSFSDEQAIRIALLLGIPTSTVVADMHAARARSKIAQDFWRGLANSRCKSVT